MILKYLSFAIALIFMSFIVGMVMTSILRKTDFYNKTLANLNLIKSEVLNKIIGIGVIKWIVKNTFFKFFNQKLKIDGKINLTELKIIRNEMTKSEIDHLFAFIFVCIFIIIKLYNQEYLFAFIILIVNILMNIYPSLLQQQNKRRIDNLIKRFRIEKR